jgi:hypothetical protein
MPAAADPEQPLHSHFLTQQPRGSADFNVSVQCLSELLLHAMRSRLCWFGIAVPRGRENGTPLVIRVDRGAPKSNTNADETEPNRKRY